MSEPARNHSLEQFAIGMIRTAVLKRGFCPDCNRRIVGTNCGVYRERDGERILERWPDNSITHKPFTGDWCQVHTEYAEEVQP